MATAELHSPIDEREFVLAPQSKAEQDLAPPVGSKVLMPDHGNPVDANPAPSASTMQTQQLPTSQAGPTATAPQSTAVEGLFMAPNGAPTKPTQAGGLPIPPPSSDAAPLTQEPTPSAVREADSSGSKQSQQATHEAVQNAPVNAPPPAEAVAPPPAAIMEDEKSGPPRHTPILAPLASCQPVHTKPLTSDQQAKYDRLLQTAASWAVVGKLGVKSEADTPITETDKMWMTRECLLRYLRATKWNEPEAAKRLMGSLLWRRDYGVSGFTPDYISPENETGKQVILGFDNAARPCLYLNPGRQNTETSPRQIQHLVYMLERTIDMMPPGQENLTLLIDFAATKSKTTPSVSQGRQVMSILQNQYPERLGRSVVINIPWFVNTFLKIIGPFIDPVTREKLRFNEPMQDHVPPSQLLKEMGGQLEFVYDHQVYWPAMNQLAAQKRKEMIRRWEQAGKRVGESESYIRGGTGVGSLNLTGDPKENQRPMSKGANGAAVDGTSMPDVGKLKV